MYETFPDDEGDDILFTNPFILEEQDLEIKSSIEEDRGPSPTRRLPSMKRPKKPVGHPLVLTDFACPADSDWLPLGVIIGKLSFEMY